MVAASRADLFERLEELGIETRTIEHEAAFTVEQSRVLDKDLPGGHTKNLFLKDKKGNLVLIVALNDAVIRLNHAHKKLNCQRLSFGSGELLQEILGVVPGSVTPFSLMNDTDNRVRVVLDKPMMEHELLNYHPLENTATTNIRREDLLKFIGSCGHSPEIVAVSETADEGGQTGSD